MRNVHDSFGGLDAVFILRNCLVLGLHLIVSDHPSYFIAVPIIGEIGIGH